MPKAVVRGFVPAVRTAAEAPALPTAQAKAKGRDARPEGRGRRCVRFMRLSLSVSRSWLKVLAEHAASMVPTETAVKGSQATGPPAARKPEDVVRTTSALRGVVEGLRKHRCEKRRASNTGGAVSKASPLKFNGS